MKTSILPLCGLAVTLAACGTVGRDVDYLSTEYHTAEPSVIVQVESTEGPQEMKVRRNPPGTKILVLLDSGLIKRSLAKDFGAQNNAVPKQAFEDAANKRLVEVGGPNCHTTTSMQRQDYLWEFDYACAATLPPPQPRKRR